MSLEFIKKSGGGISSTTLGILMVCVLLCTSLADFIYIRKEIHKSYEDNIVLHYLYLESLYYIRNEIYEETYYDLSYEADNISIDLKIKSIVKEAELHITYKDLKIDKYYHFSSDCLCIIGEYTPDNKDNS